MGILKLDLFQNAYLEFSSALWVSYRDWSSAISLFLSLSWLSRDILSCFSRSSRTESCVSELLWLALRLRQAEFRLLDALVTSARRWDMSRSVAVFNSPKLRRKATTSRHKERRRLCSLLKYSLNDCYMKQNIHC